MSPVNSRGLFINQALPAELVQIISEVNEYGFYAIDFADFAPDIQDTVELMYVANLWAARANLTVAFNFDNRICVFEKRGL
ncbi:MAG: hypothetical protein ABL859_05295 [Methylotenera sp.]